MLGGVCCVMGILVMRLRSRQRNDRCWRNEKSRDKRVPKTRKFWAEFMRFN